MLRRQLACAAFLAIPILNSDAGDIVLADFEGGTYGDWKATGAAFGSAPSTSTMPNGKKIEGCSGKGLACSYHPNDKSTGTLTSPEFTIERPWLNFLIGGGGLAGRTCFNLLIDGKVVRTATGPNLGRGGSEALSAHSWDVKEFIGKTGVLEVVDNATGGWGHINVDRIVASDAPVTPILAVSARKITIAHPWLRLPVDPKAASQQLTFLVDGTEDRGIEIQLADETPPQWVWKDVSALHGREITLKADNAKALALIEQRDAIEYPADLYHETARPQFHFSPKIGWLNDPNGLVFYKGEFHLFFQYNPYGVASANKHWGHAVSRDLIHWQELPIALYPDEMGSMYSGSAVVDWNNTSGFGKDGDPPLVLIYTAAGSSTTQCLAYSTDGRTFTKYSGNPVLGEIAHGNRDPKVMWYEPTQRWIMVLYVGFPTGEKDAQGKLKKDAKGRELLRHTVLFLSSPNLKDWTKLSEIPFGAECPDFFELPVGSNSKNGKWVLTSATSDYMIGRFDGTTFHPETPMLDGHPGREYYAAQHFSDLPDARCVTIGWLRAPSPGMPFNQAMSIPTERRLVITPDGLRLGWFPIDELKKLRGAATKLGPLTLQPGEANPIAAVHDRELEIRLKFAPEENTRVTLDLHGAEIIYDTKNQLISLAGKAIPLPLRDGGQVLTIYLDRTTIEIFADGGLVYAAKPFVAVPANVNVSLRVADGSAQIDELELYPLSSIWK